MDPKTKTEFVRRALVDAGHDINKRQIRAIHKYLQFRSGKILDLNTYEVKSPDGMDGVLILRHAIYERFLDIKRIKSPSGKLKRKKSYPIHNRIIWGSLPKLANDLMWGMVDSVIAEIKEDLEIK